MGLLIAVSENRKEKFSGFASSVLSNYICVTPYILQAFPAQLVAPTVACKPKKA